MTSKNNLEKLAWEESPAGSIQLKAKKIFNKREVQKKITEQDVKWLDINSAKQMSADKDLVIEFEAKEEELKKQHDALKEEFKQKWDAMMISFYQERLDYLLSIEQRE